MPGVVMLTWTIPSGRWPAWPPEKRARELATASSWSIPTPGKPNPVRVVEGGRSLERFDQTQLVVEVEWAHLDRGVAARPIRMSGHGAHTAAALDQRTGNCPTWSS